MGFLGDFGSFLGGAVNKVVKTVTNPARLTTAIATGGLSVVAPKTFAPLTNLTQKTLFNPQLLTAVATRNPSALLSGLVPTQLPQIQTGGNMALNLGSILGTVSNIFGGGQNPIFQGISNVTGLASQFVPQPMAQPVAARMPQMIAPALRSAGTVGRSFFNKYPNLATAMQGLRNMGRKVTRGQLYSMLRRFGPEILVSGGILTAAAVSELMVAGPGRRRMNPGNVSALRRSMRRLESFHKLCVKSDHLRRPRGRSKPCRTNGSNFVRQG